MVGQFVKETRLINEMRKHLSEITGTSPKELSDYYCINELLNELESMRIAEFELKLHELPDIFQ